jgi:hypothetical protein
MVKKQDLGWLLTMPLDEADQYIRDRMGEHQQQLSRWRLARGARVLHELAAGRKPAEVAVAIDASTTVVHALAAEARRGFVALGPSPEQWWEGLDDDDRAAFLQAARRPYGISPELAGKMQRAGALVVWAGFGDLRPVLPEPYTTFLRSMAKDTST